MNLEYRNRWRRVGYRCVVRAIRGIEGAERGAGYPYNKTRGLRVYGELSFVRRRPCRKSVRVVLNSFLPLVYIIVVRRFNSLVEDATDA